MTSSHGAAFFDVDETVVNIKTMFSFLEYYSTAVDTDMGDYAEMHALLVHTGAHHPREVVNRDYYRLFAGHSWSQLRQCGRRWAATTLGPDVWIPQTQLALSKHRRAGRSIVLVSGSFLPALAPIAERVGACAVLCSSPIVDGDVLTGELAGPPMIGRHKALAVTEYMNDHNIDAGHSYAYGDHPSDNAMLATVAHSTMIAA